MADGLDPLVFRTWLATYSYHTVGLAGDSCACPLACWLSELYGQPYVVCGGRYGPLDGADVPLPGWAKRFAELVDCTYGYRRVLRVGALSLLNRCLREVCATKDMGVPESSHYTVYVQGTDGSFDLYAGSVEGERDLLALLQRFVLQVGHSFLVLVQSAEDRRKEVELMAKNIDTKVTGDKLIITIDLTKSFGLSGSGKSEIIASTEGNISLPGREEIKIGVNVYRPAKPR